MSYHISSRAKETDKGLGEIQLWFMGMDVDVDVCYLCDSGCMCMGGWIHGVSFL